jgi:NitT/TauT family transport system substrate-binding protein
MHITSIEAGIQIKVLAGLHSGCLELIANDTIHSVADLKGKRVGVWIPGSEQVHVSLMAAYVGLDPERDIEWVHRGGMVTELFLQGKIDAFLAGPPTVQKARAQKIGHVILNSTTDPPWSQQFCCMISARAEYVSSFPIATKRVLRAILKSADLCASNPSSAARKLVDRGFVPSYDYALQTLNDIRYDNWREYDPEASLLFFGLRMQEVGMIKSNPQKLIAQGTDWRFVNELKRELKA